MSEDLGFDPEIFETDNKLIYLDDEGAHVIARSVAEKLEKKKLSASMITGLLGDTGCAARWLADNFAVREVVEEEPDNPARRGSLFHKVMEDLFALEPEERTQTKVKELAVQTLKSDEFKDLSTSRDVFEWLKSAINGYYNMGGNPEKVQVAEIVMDESKGPQKGLEIFVKGKIGNTKREILGFIDRLVLNTVREDGSLIIEDWKGLALDTLLPTPSGWTTMGDVQEGDEILGSNGKTTKVLNKSDIHNRPCYEIEFMDGSSVISDNVHLWDIKTSATKKTENYGASQSKNLVVDTDELFNLWQTHGRDYIQIKNPEPITAFEEKELSIHPYLLGAWLGDGRNRAAEISAGKEDANEMRDILQKYWAGQVRIRENGDERALSILFDKPFPELCGRGHEYSNAYDNGAKYCANCTKNRLNPKQRTNISLTTILKREGLTHNKHVPAAYLRGSIEQRISLLQGLMDTDGYWHPKRKRALFYTTTKALSDAVAEIVVSLGITPSIYRGENEYKGFYEVGFSPVGFNPFKLTRKKDQVEEHFKNKEYRTHKALHRYIRTIKPVESVPTQCIRVDAEDSLYLCGPLMTPTHNTGKVKRWKSHTKSDEGLAEQRQQLIYKMLLEQKGFKVSGARLIYPVAGEMVKVDMKDEELAQRVIKDVEDTDKALDVMIENNTFEYKPSFLCSWCSLSRLCPQADIKPYKKMQDAFQSQPEPTLLMKVIDMR